MNKSYRVLVKLADMTRAMGLGSDGCLVDKKLYQIMFERERAEEVAEIIRGDFPDAVVTVSPF